jgi:hypothetical protein
MIGTDDTVMLPRSAPFKRKSTHTSPTQHTVAFLYLQGADDKLGQTVHTQLKQ